jgi:NAD(P)-dependent dehydrogenase (short-subunit alcohol dehydrogenase family)
MKDDKRRGKVVVVTGASSGLGQATAIQFVAAGNPVVVAARRAEALATTVAACERAGGIALPFVTDVTSEEQVHRLAEFAFSRFGRIDVWVNNAGVTIFARLEEGSFAEHRRVLETNLYGAIYGARAVVPIFRAQHAGVLINVGSVLSKIGQPFVPSYVISKFGLRGLSEALRSELADEPRIHVCSIYPYAMDTEHFQSGANHLGRAAHPMPPLQSPEKVARTIVELAARPRRELHVPRAAVAGLALHKLAPRLTERVLFDALSRWHFSGAFDFRATGNLFNPNQPDGSVHGKRQPIVGTMRLLTWALARFCGLPFAGVGRRLRELTEPR